MHSIPATRTTRSESCASLCAYIVRELRETIYQLRSNASEVEDIVSVAARYSKRFSERTGYRDQMAAVGVECTAVSHRAGALAHCAGSPRMWSVTPT